MSMKKGASARRKARLKKAHRREVELLTTKVRAVQDDLRRERRQNNIPVIGAGFPLPDYSDQVFTTLAIKLGESLADEIVNNNPSMHRAVLRDICRNAYTEFMDVVGYRGMNDIRAMMRHDIMDDVLVHAMELVPTKTTRMNYAVPFEVYRLAR